MPQKSPPPNRYDLRSGLTLYPPQQEAIETILTDLLQQAPAHFILLADVTGQIVSTRGERGQINLIALGSLVAGDLAASQEIARLTGQYQDYQMILREGSTTHTFICEAGFHLALLVQVTIDTPLGWARMVIRQAAHKLTDIITEAEAEAEAAAQPPPGLNIDADDLLGDLDDALDDLWKG